MIKMTGTLYRADGTKRAFSTIAENLMTDFPKPELRTDLIYKLAVVGEEEYPFAFIDLTQSEDHAIFGFVHSIESWSLDGKQIGPSLEVLDCYFKWDGCSHVTSASYNHVCGFSNAITDFQKVEAMFFLASRHCNTHEDEADDFGVGFKPRLDREFHEEVYSSRVGDEIIITRITADMIEGEQTSLDFLRKNRKAKS
jgi:hypothetical protein